MANRRRPQVSLRPPYDTGWAVASSSKFARFGHLRRTQCRCRQIQTTSLDLPIQGEHRGGTTAWQPKFGIAGQARLQLLLPLFMVY
jgi:hypothetical protein